MDLDPSDRIQMPDSSFVKGCLGKPVGVSQRAHISLWFQSIGSQVSGTSRLSTRMNLQTVSQLHLKYVVP